MAAPHAGRFRRAHLPRRSRSFSAHAFEQLTTDPLRGSERQVCLPAPRRPARATRLSQPARNLNFDDRLLMTMNHGDAVDAGSNRLQVDALRPPPHTSPTSAATAGQAL